MKIITVALSLLVFVLIQGGCRKNVDNEKPQVILNFPNAFPVNCDTLYFGWPYLFRLKFVDNQELGDFRIDIHHNFDHHTHSTDYVACVLDASKQPVNPYRYLKTHYIPGGQKEYIAEIVVVLPPENEFGKFDEGDYHMQVMISDKSGWSSMKGISLKLLYQ